MRPYEPRTMFSIKKSLMGPGQRSPFIRSYYPGRRVSKVKSDETKTRLSENESLCFQEKGLKGRNFDKPRTSISKGEVL